MLLQLSVGVHMGTCDDVRYNYNFAYRQLSAARGHEPQHTQILLKGFSTISNLCPDRCLCLQTNASCKINELLDQGFALLLRHDTTPRQLSKSSTQKPSSSLTMSHIAAAHSRAAYLKSCTLHPGIPVYTCMIPLNLALLNRAGKMHKDEMHLYNPRKSDNLRRSRP